MTSSATVIDLENIGYVFDRRQALHPWEPAIDQLQNSSVPGYAGLAANWRIDHRVSSAREEELKGSGYFPTTEASFSFVKSISDYFSYCQCRSVNNELKAGYAGDTNIANLIPRTERPARNHKLLHFSSLNALLRFIFRDRIRIADLQIQLSDLIEDRPITTVTASEVDRLADAINAKGSDAVKSLARILSDALGENEPHWWAAFAHEVGNFSVTDDWTDAVRVLGLGHFEVGERLLAWRYSPEIVGRMFRPTVAEARDSAFHFPSPPKVSYGITMPLDDGLVALKELIHAPLKGDVCADSCIDLIGKVANPPIPVNDSFDLHQWFIQRRNTHREYLLNQNGFDDVMCNWIYRHRGLP